MRTTSVLPVYIHTHTVSCQYTVSCALYHTSSSLIYTVPLPVYMHTVPLRNTLHKSHTQSAATSLFQALHAGYKEIKSRPRKHHKSTNITRLYGTLTTNRWDHRMH
jgi:hypothetical protein